MLELEPAFFSGRVDLWGLYVILRVRVDLNEVAHGHVFVYGAVHLFDGLVILQIQAVTDVAQLLFQFIC